ITKPSAASADGRFGAKPPSSPTLVLWPASCSAFLRVWNTSTPMRSASRKLGAPTGMIMNSWKSIGLFGWRAHRNNNESLEVDRIVGVHAAVDDVHHRHRQEPRRRAADIAVERQAARD